MTLNLRFTEEALADLEPLYEFAVAREDGDWATAERALDAIRNGLALWAGSPFSCRKAAPVNTFLRELIIAFGASGGLTPAFDVRCELQTPSSHNLAARPMIVGA